MTLLSFGFQASKRPRGDNGAGGPAQAPVEPAAGAPVAEQAAVSDNVDNNAESTKKKKGPMLATTVANIQSFYPFAVHVEPTETGDKWSCSTCDANDPCSSKDPKFYQWKDANAVKVHTTSNRHKRAVEAAEERANMEVCSVGLPHCSIPS